MNRWLQAGRMKYESIREEQRALKDELTQVLQAAFDEKAARSTRTRTRSIEHKRSASRRCSTSCQRKTLLRGGRLRARADSSRSSPTRCDAPLEARRRSRASGPRSASRVDRLAASSRASPTPTSARLLPAAQRRPEDLLAGLPALARSMPLCVSRTSWRRRTTSSTRRASGSASSSRGSASPSTSRWRSLGVHKRPETSVEKFQKVRVRRALQLRPRGQAADWSPWCVDHRRPAPTPQRQALTAPSATSTRSSCARRCSRCRWLHRRQGQGPALPGGVRQVLRGEAQGTTLIETELGGIMHPNQFFEESAKFYAPRDAKGGARRARRDHRAAAGRRRGGRVEPRYLKALSPLPKAEHPTVHTSPARPFTPASSPNAMATAVFAVLACLAGPSLERLAVSTRRSRRSALRRRRSRRSTTARGARGGITRLSAARCQQRRRHRVHRVPGLYPTIAGKVCRNAPFASKAALYEMLDADEKAKLKSTSTSVNARSSDVRRAPQRPPRFREPCPAEPRLRPRQIMQQNAGSRFTLQGRRRQVVELVPRRADRPAPGRAARQPLLTAVRT